MRPYRTSSASKNRKAASHLASFAAMQQQGSPPKTTPDSSQASLTTTASNSDNKAKRDVACSRSSPREFFLVFFLGCSRKILGVKPEYRLAFYLLIVFLCSLFGELFAMPKDASLLLRVSRPINTFVVKFGFGWVFLLSVPLIILTSRVYSRNSTVTTLSSFGRLCVNTLIWFVTTSVFFWYYASKGFCHIASQSNATHTTLKSLIFHDCKRQGFQWSGFDVSGHTFLLIFCNMVLLEECRVMKLVDKYFYQAQQQSVSVVSEVASGQAESPSTKHERLYLQITLCLSAITVISYDWTLVMTSLFYHTILEKMLAFVFASGAWYLFYRVFYPRMGIQPGSGSSANLNAQHLL